MEFNVDWRMTLFQVLSLGLLLNFLNNISAFVSSSINLPSYLFNFFLAAALVLLSLLLSLLIVMGLRKLGVVS